MSVIQQVLPPSRTIARRLGVVAALAALAVGLGGAAAWTARDVRRLASRATGLGDGHGTGERAPVGRRERALEEAEQALAAGLALPPCDGSECVEPPGNG